MPDGIPLVFQRNIINYPTFSIVYSTILVCNLKQHYVWYSA